MDRRIAILGLAAAGVSQVAYGLLFTTFNEWSLFQLAEGTGLLLAAAGLHRTRDLPGRWLPAGLALAAAASLPWFTRIAGFEGLGPVASLANNTGSVVAALAAGAWFLAAAAPATARAAVVLGLGLQALGALLWVTLDGGRSIWTFAYLLAFLGFAAGAFAFPTPEAPPARPAARAAAARKAP